MHIPDAYLSPATEAAAYGVMLPFWAIAVRKTSRELSAKQVPLLSIGAAFCFAVQMFNVPTVGGTTAHALGSTLLAILVGPWAALIGMTLELAIQALLFGDGGILTLGANVWDMGVVACFVGYGLYRLLSGRSEAHSRRRLFAAGFGAYCGTVTASLSAGILLGIQPAIAHDATGHALYCPFALNVSVPAMVMSHLLMAGPAEAIITVAALAYLWSAFPDLANETARVRVDVGARIARKLVWVLALTPLGLIASGDAFGEWDLDTLKRMIGYAPAGLAHAHRLVHPLLPDYGFEGLTATPAVVVGYLVSAFLGCCAIAAFTLGIWRGTKQKPVRERAPEPPDAMIPAWMRRPNPPARGLARSRGRWFESTVKRLRRAAERTIAAEEVARSPGFLQAIHPVAKSVGFLAALVAVGLSQSIWVLLGFLVLVIACARASSVGVRGFLERVSGAVAFFGIVVALPMVLQPGESPQVAFRLIGVTFYSAGLLAAGLIIARLAAGISLAMLWSLTTRWHDLLRSLRALGVPHLFLTSAQLTYRYLFVVTETLGEMVDARISRQVGAVDKRQARTYAGSGTAILFAKSQTLTEEVHQAIQSRTLEAVPRTGWDRAWRTTDSFIVAVGLMSLVFVALAVAHAF